MDRVCVIDIGSVSLRLHIGCLKEPDGLQILYTDSEICCLGRGLFSGKEIPPESIKRVLDALESMLSRARDKLPERGVCVGTHSLRVAANGDEVAACIRDRSGYPVEIISPDREAELAWNGSRDLLEMGDMLSDLGGGSTECLAPTASGKWQVFSVAAGAGSSLVPFSMGNMITSDQRKILCDQAGKSLSPLAEAFHGRRPENLVVLGGTVTTLAAMDAGIRNYFAGCVHGYRLHRETINVLFHRLADCESEQRQVLPGMEPHRGTVILTGTALLGNLCDIFEMDSIVVSEQGISHGRLLEILRESQI